MGVKPELIAPEKPIERMLYVHNYEAKIVVLLFNRKGTLGSNINEIDGDHIIVVLTE